MMDKKGYYKYSLKISINILIGGVIFLVMKSLDINLHLFKNICILILVMIVTGYCINQKLFKNDIVNLMIYICLLIIILFIRPIKKEMIVSNFDYIVKWLRVVFTNKIVFRNLFGNILLFIPLGIFFKQFKIKHIYIGLLIILTIESIQLILRVGIFDIIDICLNFIGFLIGYLLYNKKR